MFRRALIPLDGSKAAAQIIEQIEVVLPPGLREVLLIHVAPKVHFNEGRVAILVEREVREREAELRKIAAKLQASGVLARVIIRRGDPVEQIVYTAIEEAADVIAMTKLGFSAIGRILVGSVADKVVRHSPVPVLLVRAGSFWRRGAQATPPEKILVPLDGSHRALGILTSVQKLARGFGSRITLLYVACDKQNGVLPYEDLDRPPASVVEKQMRKAAARLRKKGARVSVAVLRGDPAEQILRLQRAQRFDLIAMSTHGRSGFERWLLGSVTEKVLKAADVPLMVLRNVHVKPHTYKRRRSAEKVN